MHATQPRLDPLGISMQRPVHFTKTSPKRSAVMEMMGDSKVEKVVAHALKRPVGAVEGNIVIEMGRPKLVRVRTSETLRGLRIG